MKFTRSHLTGVFSALFVLSLFSVVHVNNQLERGTTQAQAQTVSAADNPSLVCSWCGSTCGFVEPGAKCPDVQPPANMTCAYFETDNLCVAVADRGGDNPPPNPDKTCIVTGCSNHICSDTPVNTTCEYRPEYACYESATCEVQSDGECGWTRTDDLEQCLESGGGGSDVTAQPDIDGDQDVDVWDYIKFVELYGYQGPSKADFNGDQLVGSADYQIFVSAYTGMR